MFRIDTASAAGALPAPGAAGAPGYFTNGNPATGMPPTTITADWLNGIQEEILSVLAAAGIAENKTSFNQLLTALQALFVSSSGLPASFSTAGYAKLPGGLIIQWATVSGTVGSGATYSFPITFPNACRFCHATYKDNSSSGNGGSILDASSISASQYSTTWISNYNTGGSGDSASIKMIALGN